MAELLEVEPVRLVEVRRDRLRIAVDDDGCVTQGSESSNARDTAPVELNAAADPVWPTSEHDNSGISILLVLAALHILGHGDNIP